MCDYSLHAIATRPAVVGETLISTKFRGTLTRGFAADDNPQVAVCLRPGTELVFEDDVLWSSFVFNRRVGSRLARFRQINPEISNQHHDALEFGDGQVILLTELAVGQKATVLQLPVVPATAEKAEPAPVTEAEAVLPEA